MTAPHSTTGPDDTIRKIDLNLTQVAAAALAAVTAAVLGSGLGAAGTLIGAAGASVITTVGTAVYRASLERSQQRVRALARRTRPLPTSREGVGNELSHPAAAHASFGDELRTAGSDREPRPGGRSRQLATLRWGAAIVGAIGGFVLAMMVITGFEWASGETLSGKSEGTTIGQVVQAPPGPPSPRHRAPSSSETPTSEPPTETSTATTTTTTTPDGGTSVELSPSPTSGTPAPSGPTSSLIPTRLPGVGE
ncbi:MAG TPA: hypothetical protein VFQ77_09100 [Pseudonocardiaceae bacterium]|nr:hypothetical protein [Pseudonocardiaceae bacterium]